MMIKKKLVAGFLCLFVLHVFASSTIAKTVYAIIKHSAPSTLKAYDISGNQLEEYPNNSGIIDVSDILPDQGYGAVGVAVWPDIETAFFSYEQITDIAMASTKTLEGKGVVNTGIENENGLAGIATDEQKAKLYILTRTNDELYVYTWDAVNETLVLEHPNDPCYPDRKYHLLAGLGNAGYGIAVDEINDVLFATNGSSSVKCYDTTTWELTGSIDTGRYAIAIGIDYENGYLYTGSGFPTAHDFLVKTDLNDPNNIVIIEKNLATSAPGTHATGIAVDNDTGLVYITSPNNRVAVYDTSGWTSDPCQVITPTDYETDGVSGPAGIAVGSQYKPARMVYLDKDDGLDPCDPCSPLCYAPGDEFTYTITYGHAGYDHEWVEVTDFLPRETTFLSSTPQYDSYNSEENSYFWDLGSLTTNDPNNNTITIDVLVNEMADPNSFIINTAIIETDIAYKV